MGGPVNWTNAPKEHVGCTDTGQVQVTPMSLEATPVPTEAPRPCPTVQTTVDTIRVDVAIKGLDYDGLISNPTMVIPFKVAVRMALKQEIGSRGQEVDIDINLAKG